MLLELEQLAQRIDQLAAVTRYLRRENQTLRMQLAERETEVGSLRGKLDEAHQRVQALLQQLPSDE